MAELTFHSQSLTQNAISKVQDEWSDLGQNAIERNVFLMPWFIAASLELLAACQPDLVCVRRNGRLIGLTLMHPERGYSGVPVRFFRNSFHYHQFLATPLIRQGHARDFFIGLGRWIDSAPASRHFCVMHLLSDDEGLATVAREVFQSEGRATALVDEFERAAIKPRSPDDAVSAPPISKSRLKSLRRKRSQLAKLGTVRIDRFSKGESAQAWLDDFIRVENTGWKHEAGTSIAENPQDIRFYRALIAHGDEEDAVTFLRLSVGGVPIAYTLDLRSGPFAYCLKCAHDAAYRQYAPGVILEHETLQDYSGSKQPVWVDSCSSPDNQMLNELWPDKKRIAAFAFAKRGFRHSVALKTIFKLKRVATRTGIISRQGK